MVTDEERRKFKGWATQVVIRLPGWCLEFPVGTGIFETAYQRAALAVRLSRENVSHRTGGPFGAAVFEAASGRLLAVGVNLVESSGLSLAHAEMVAISLAQATVGHFNLGASAAGPVELATSAEPCAMCLGALPWAGLSRVICSARGSDAEAIGFDEGNKPRDWIRGLKRRGIEVVLDLCRDQAVEVLTSYRRRGGMIYTGSAGYLSSHSPLRSSQFPERNHVTGSRPAPR